MNRCSKALLTTSKIEELYEVNCIKKSDIYKHLPILLKYAKRCKHITEMGARTGMSTSAFMHARVEKFVSYDYQYSNPEPHLKQQIERLKNTFNLARQEGINCQFIGADVLQVNIEQTDLLFLDTWHCYDQLKRELELHASKVNKYIIFHDVISYGVKGEGYPSLDTNHPQRNNFNGDKGIKPAIIEFLQANIDWKVEYQTKECNGLLIISKSIILG